MYCTTYREHTSASAFDKNLFDGTNNFSRICEKKHKASIAHKTAKLKQYTANCPTETSQL